MDRILQALYDGKIYPAEQFRPMIEEFKILQEKKREHYENFIKKLNSPLDEEFDNIMDEQLDTLPLELRERFIDGFRLGARMMVEVFEDKYQKDDC